MEQCPSPLTAPALSTIVIYSLFEEVSDLGEAIVTGVKPQGAFRFFKNISPEPVFPPGSSTDHKESSSNGFLRTPSEWIAGR